MNQSKMTTNTLSIEDQIEAFYLDIARVDQQLAEFAIARAQLTKDIAEVFKLAEHVKVLTKNFLSLQEHIILQLAHLQAIKDRLDDLDDSDEPITLN